MMDEARWARVQALFHAAVELPLGRRAELLDAETAGQPELRAEVESLLAEDAGFAPVLDPGLAAVASAVLGVAPGLLEQPFGPYRIVDVLGEGGMGTVYRARRDDLGSAAALKVLRDASLSPSRRERFAAEQRTLAQLNHPAIAQLYDADTLTDGTPWFAMEYVDGVPITTYCERRATSLRGRLLLFRAVCDAVLHAHRHAVIHRDIKPSNILVKDDGTVKLLDFGIAKQLENLDDAADQTRTGLRLMTPAYAAPEQIRGERVGTFTDVFALGVVLYELLAGRLPFSPSDGLATAPVRLDREPDRPSAAARQATPPRPFAPVSRGVWADLDVLCLTAMHADPQRRYRTVDALIRDIDHFLNGEPLDARPDTVGYRLGKFVRRHRQAVAAAAAAVAILITLIAFYTVRLTLARDEARAEATRTQRIQRFMLTLFEGGDEEAGPADSLRVLTLIDRGLREASGLTSEPGVQAELYATLGGIYEKLGHPARADTLLQRALAQRRELHGLDHPDVARSLVALGLLRLDEGRFEEADSLVREGLAMLERHRPPTHPDVANTLTALGRVLEERGRYDEAIGVLERVVALHPAGSTNPEVAAALFGIAGNHFYAGRYAIADSLTRVVLSLNRQLRGDRHPSIADALTNLGAIQQELGNYDMAERHHREALEIVRAWYGEEHPRTAASLTMVGRALLFLDRYAEAEATQRRALAILERVYGPVHPRVASALNEIAGAAYMKDELDTAEDAYRRVLSIYRQLYPDGHFFIGIMLANLAGVYMDRGDYGPAERLFREALAVYAATLPAGHLNVGITRIKLGRTLLRAGRYREAVDESRAGYDILNGQANPSVSFLRAARRDLVTAYDSLGEPEAAARFRAELADTTSRATSSR